MPGALLVTLVSGKSLLPLLSSALAVKIDICRGQFFEREEPLGPLPRGFAQTRTQVAIGKKAQQGRGDRCGIVRITMQA